MHTAEVIVAWVGLGVQAFVLAGLAYSWWVDR